MTEHQESLSDLIKERGKITKVSHWCLIDKYGRNYPNCLNCVGGFWHRFFDFFDHYSFKNINGVYRELRKQHNEQH